MDCPSRDILSGFMLGKLPAEAIERIGRHIETCATCQAALETLDDLEDSVLRDLKGGAGQAGSVSPDLADQMRRAEDISRVVWCKRPHREVLSDDAQPPKRLGHYDLLEQIGQGGMGAVYKARHTRLKRHAAVKLLPPRRMLDPQAVARFEGEMEAVGRLDHPNLIRAYDAGEADGRHFLAMEYVDGVDLARLVRRRGPLPVADACEIVRQAALGLQYAHENGLVHRDVKPSNVMLTHNGQVRILDLGLARLHEESVPDERDTAAGQVFGTGDFIAPEQGQDTRQADARSDIYSLGCTLYFLLAGRAPFSRPTHKTFTQKVMAHVQQPIPPITAYRDDVPEAVLAVLERMTAKSPDQRFQSAADVARAMEACVAGADLQSVLPQQPLQDERKKTTFRSRFLRTALWIVGLLLMLAVPSSLVYWYSGTVVYVVRNLPDPAENARLVDEINRDLAEMDRELAGDLAEMQRESDAEFPDVAPMPQPTAVAPVVAPGVHQSEHFDRWLVIGPFLFNSISEAYDAEHPIEMEPFDENRRFDTSEGEVGWCRYEAPTEADSRIVVTDAAGRAPPVGRVGVYYAMCWVKFASRPGSVSLRLFSSCPYKLWINRTPATGTPKQGDTTVSGQLLAHGGTDGWNELLFKFVVSADREKPADFRLYFRRGQDRFGRPIEQPLPLITIERPKPGA